MFYFFYIAARLHNVKADGTYFFLSVSRLWADSAPEVSLLSYMAYLSRTDGGDKLGITTLAPARIPFKRPSFSMLPSAVVAGSRILGCISRIRDRR